MHTVLIAKSVEKKLAKINKADYERVKSVIASLAEILRQAVVRVR